MHDEQRCADNGRAQSDTMADAVGDFFAKGLVAFVRPSFGPCGGLLLHIRNMELSAVILSAACTFGNPDFARTMSA